MKIFDSVCFNLSKKSYKSCRKPYQSDLVFLGRTKTYITFDLRHRVLIVLMLYFCESNFDEEKFSLVLYLCLILIWLHSYYLTAIKLSSTEYSGSVPLETISGLLDVIVDPSIRLGFIVI